MISTKELRIGNLIHPLSTAAGIHIPATGIILKVVEVLESSVKAIFYDQDILKATTYQEFGCRKISPIKLTPEILEQCGFEKYDHNIHYFGYQKDGFKVPFEGESVFMVDFKSAPLFEPWAEKKKIYLHQLQNLYFALTGEELVYQPIKELKTVSAT